jgi:hypothetical protein
MIRRNSIRRFLSSFHRIMAFRHILTVIALTIGLNSCYNEPELLGGNLIPSTDLTKVKVDTSFEVAAYTVKTDSISTSGYQYAILGCATSNIFGQVKSDFLSEIYIYNIKDTLHLITPRPVPDYLELTIRHNKTWGTNHKPINVKVYELSDSLSTHTYNNGLVPVEGKYNPTLISMPTTYSGDSLLTIRLTSDFANKLINAPDSTFTSNLNFIKFMKGIFITSDEYSGPDGVLYYFDPYINLTLHYKKPKKNGTLIDTVFTYYSTNSLRYNHFSHDYTKARTDLKINHLNSTTLNDTIYQDSLIYIDGLGGVRGLIKLKGTKEWAKKMPIAINRAELRFDVQDHPDFVRDSLTPNLFYYYYRYLNSAIITDYITNLDDYYFNGKINATKYSTPRKYYSIDVTFHLQNLLRGKHSKDYFFIEPSDFIARYRQGIIRSGKNSNRMKLVITYSKL